jgi:hypothetical protein
MSGQEPGGQAFPGWSLGARTTYKRCAATAIWGKVIVQKLDSENSGFTERETGADMNPNMSLTELLKNGSAKELLDWAVDNTHTDMVQYSIAVKLTRDLTESIDRASQSSNRVQWALVLVGTGMWAYLLFEVVKLLFLNQ